MAVSHCQRFAQLQGLSNELFAVHAGIFSSTSLLAILVRVVGWLTYLCQLLPFVSGQCCKRHPTAWTTLRAVTFHCQNIQYLHLRAVAPLDWFIYSDSEEGSMALAGVLVPLRLRFSSLSLLKPWSSPQQTRFLKYGYVIFILLLGATLIACFWCGPRRMPGPGVF